MAQLKNQRLPEVKYYPSDASTGFGDGGRASKLLCEELKEGHSDRTEASSLVLLGVYRV